MMPRPAGGNPVDRFALLPPRPALGYEDAPRLTGRGEQDTVAHQTDGGGDGAGVRPAEQQGSLGGAARPGTRVLWMLGSAALFQLLSESWYYRWVNTPPNGIDGGPLGFLTWTIPLLVGT